MDNVHLNMAGMCGTFHLELAQLKRRTKKRMTVLSAFEMNSFTLKSLFAVNWHKSTLIRLSLTLHVPTSEFRLICLQIVSESSASFFIIKNIYTIYKFIINKNQHALVYCKLDVLQTRQDVECMLLYEIPTLPVHQYKHAGHI